MKWKLSSFLITALSIVGCDDSTDIESGPQDPDYYFQITIDDLEYEIVDSELLTWRFTEYSYGPGFQDSLKTTSVQLILHNNYIPEDFPQKIDSDKPIDDLYFNIIFRYDPSHWWGSHELHQHLRSELVPTLGFQSVDQRVPGIQLHYLQNQVDGSGAYPIVQTGGHWGNFNDDGTPRWTYSEMPDSEIEFTEYRKITDDTVRMVGNFNCRMYSPNGRDTIRASGDFVLPLPYRPTP